MEENPTTIHHTRLLFIVAIAGLLITVMGVWYFISLSRLGPSTTQNQNDPAIGLNPELIAGRIQNSQANTIKTSIPEVYFEKYELKTALPNIPPGLQTYRLKTNFAPNETAAIAAKLNLSTQEPSQDYNFVKYINTTNPQSFGELIFNRQTGAFSFSSFGIHRPSTVEGLTPAQLAEKYLTEIGFDSTIKCTDRYERKELSSRIHVVCHRDWAAVSNTPIFNFPGILNVDEDTPLATLALGAPALSTPKDDQIINTTNNGNGKMPLTDFNTAVVTIEKSTNRIVAIDSNLRFIQSAETMQTADLFSPEEALQKFANHQSELALPVLAGQGYVEWTKVFPQNKAHGKNAKITDFMLIYPELPPSVPQTNLTAYYLIRGTSELNSGYTSKFIELVPATRKQLTFLPANKNVAGETTSRSSPDDKGVKQGTFNFPWLTPIPTNTPAPNPSRDEVCLIPNDTEEIILHIPDVGDMVVARFKSNVAQQPHMLFFKSAPFPASSAREKLFGPSGPVAKAYSLLVARQLSRTPQLLADTTLTVEEDVYAIYEKINRLHPLTPGDSNYCNMNLSYAPPTPSCIQALARAPNNYYNAEFLQVISYSVAQQILGLQNDGRLQSFGNEPNPLPDDIMSNLFWLFIYDEHAVNLQTQNRADEFCYLSGVSPALFIYNNEEKNISIELPETITYTYPQSKNNIWHTTTKNNQLFTNSSLLTPISYLYYEYDPSEVELTSPHEGFIVAKENVGELINTKIKNGLRLTDEETRRLLLDINNGLRDIPSPFIKLSIANQKELHEKLPLRINPQPKNIYRVHLLLAPIVKQENISAPKLLPLSRDGYTVVEVGARKQ